MATEEKGEPGEDEDTIGVNIVYLIKYCELISSRK